MTTECARHQARREVVQIEGLRPPASGEFVSLARVLEEELEAVSRTAAKRLGEMTPGWMSDSVFSAAEIGSFVRGSLEVELRGFRRGVLPDGCPDIDARCARAAAQVGALKFLLMIYRIARSELWQAWFDRVEGSPTDAQARNELLRYGSEYFAFYAERLSDFVIEVYQHEIEQRVRSGEQRRFDAVRTLLEGSSFAASRLDVDLDQHHLGLVAWGGGGEAGARELAAALGRPLLLIGPLNGSWWGWISGSRPLTAGQERLLREFEPSGDAHLAVGLEARGEEGFRATHRQALGARRVRRDAGRRLTRYADVAVEALAADNPDDARAFVAHELRGIDDGSPASGRIRETILAYFAAGHNAASAAAALGVHQQTVANRLRAAEDRLGRSISARRVELETALRLREFLDRE